EVRGLVTAGLAQIHAGGMRNTTSFRALVAETRAPANCLRPFGRRRVGADDYSKLSPRASAGQRLSAGRLRSCSDRAARTRLRGGFASAFEVRGYSCDGVRC